MDNNTTKVLLAAIPSVAFVIVVALVIFGLSPGDCIKIEAPGGGKVTRCMPLPDSAQTVSIDQVNSLVSQIEELRILQDAQQQQRLANLKQRGSIEETPNNFMTASSIFEENQDSLSEQLQFLSSKKIKMLSEKITSDKEEINRLNKISQDLVTEGKHFSWAGKWKVTGIIGVLGLSYDGEIIFNDDQTYESNGILDGDAVSGGGTYMINEQLGTYTLYPSDLGPTQYSFVDIGDNSFIVWSPLDFEKLEFHKIIS